MQQIEINLASLPKKYVDRVAIVGTKDLFFFINIIGKEQEAFVLTPQHAKELLISFTHNIEEYEKKNGKINAEWSPNIKSPFQIENLE
jgi:hypothetical protein